MKFRVRDFEIATMNRVRIVDFATNSVQFKLKQNAEMSPNCFLLNVRFIRYHFYRIFDYHYHQNVSFALHAQRNSRVFRQFFNIIFVSRACLIMTVINEKDNIKKTKIR